MSFDPDVKSKRSLINAGSKKKLKSWKGQRQRERDKEKGCKKTIISCFPWANPC